MSRSIKLFSSRNNSTITVTFTSATPTWGDVKRAASEQGLDASDLKAVGRESQYTYDNDTSEIAENDQTIFLTPSKVKSGN